MEKKVIDPDDEGGQQTGEIERHEHLGGLLPTTTAKRLDHDRVVSKVQP